MRILLVAPEYEGLIKVGGLSDFNRAVACELKKMGHDVRVLMPQYRCLASLPTQPLTSGMPVPVSIWHTFYCDVNVYHDKQVPIYFLQNAGMYDRPGIYDEKGQAYDDNPLRFALLSQAAFSLCQTLDWQPDILHCCDWQSAMVPFYLREHHAHLPFFRATKTVLTLHNGAYQGRHAGRWHEDLGIHPKFMVPQLFEDEGCINLMKGGITLAHRVATVSPSYRDELLTKEMGHGLHKTLLPRAQALRGILNGVDNDDWSPLSDPHQAYPFDHDSLNGKAVCKQALQHRLGLPERKDTPVFAYIGRVAHQKGFDLMLPMLAQLLDSNIQVVVVGHGEAGYQARMAELERLFPERFRYLNGFDAATTRPVLGASDFLLMPSLFEPCGLTQLYALRYGTIPIVHAVGGLKSTVVPLDSHKSNASKADGYHFETPRVEDLTDVVNTALSDYQNAPFVIHQLRLNGMRKRFYWRDTAARYVDLYHELIDEPQLILDAMQA